MPCFTPLRAWASITQRNPKTGKRIIRFRKVEFEGGTEEISVHCSSCEGCRIERARQWSIRCWNESSLYEDNIFITLTFASACPLDGTKTDPIATLHLHHFQRFMKRLRKRFGKGVRYFHCGEYGEKFGRPHHHACLFNFTLPDLELHAIRRGNPCYTSKILSELWPHGIHEVGTVTLKSAAYVARYILKKVNFKNSYHHYEGRKPEYTTMSRRPGIGRDWIIKYQNDVYPDGTYVLEGGIKTLPPKAYDHWYELTYPEEYAILKQKRVDRAKADPNNTPERLKTRHEILLSKLKLLQRGYENEESG